MSYFFRQQQLAAERERVEKRGLDSALNSIADKMAGLAARAWNPELHPRGKTTPESNDGSFRPSAGGGGVERTKSGRKITPAVHDDLKEVQRVGYLKLHHNELRSHDELNTWARNRMRDLMGPGYEDLVDTMTHKIWNEFKRNAVHQYRGPRDWSETAWAVKGDLQL